MPIDRVLIDATNEAFWQITDYKRGQRLNMSIPQDREMAQVWLDIYRQIITHRDRAAEAARQIANERGLPYVVVAERRDGSLQSNVFENRSSLEVQYFWARDQPDLYTYLAAFDFTTNPSDPIYHQFALLQRQRAAVSGWY